MADHANRLIHETSPYLRQHAHNPVDWYPWGDEALAKARRENKPILLSVGYSACHWCHVMEHESFEDEETARLMNEHFVNIKVDREERPDVDHIYMNAVQMLTGRGGWPMTVFLTPDGKPFYGGTYFPPEDRHGMPAFRRVLARRRAGLSREARRRAEDRRATDGWAAAHRERCSRRPQPLDAASSPTPPQALAQAYDETHGGLGQAPKFPNESAFDLFLRAYRSTRPAALSRHGAAHAAADGARRHLRPARRRLPPLLGRRALAGAALREDALRQRPARAAVSVRVSDHRRRRSSPRIARETLDYVMREMRDAGRRLLLDAGRRQRRRGRQVLRVGLGEVRRHPRRRGGGARLPLLGHHRGRQLRGPQHPARHARDRAARQAFPPRRAEVERRLLARCARAALFAAREQRVKPGARREDAHRVERADDQRLRQGRRGARRAALSPGRASTRVAFIEAQLQRGDRLLSTYKDGVAKLNGYLDDYAFFIAALLDVFELTQDRGYLERAAPLTDCDAARTSGTQQAGGFFFTSDDHEALIVRSKPAFDGSIPSGNSVAARDLLRLYHYTERDGLSRHAPKRCCGCMPARCASSRSASPTCSAPSTSTPSSRARSSSCAAPGSQDGEALLQRIRRTYVPNRTLMVVDPSNAGRLPSLLEGKQQIDGKATVYVCHNRTCSAPVTSWPELEPLLG